MTAQQPIIIDLSSDEEQCPATVRDDSASDDEISDDELPHWLSEDPKAQSQGLPTFPAQPVTPVFKRKAVQEPPGAPTRKRRKVDKKVRTWFLTYNNYPKDWKNKLLALGARHYCCQPEISLTGTPHIQGVMHWKYKKSFAYLQTRLPEVHWERCKSIIAAMEYCQKKKTKDGPIWAKGFGIGYPTDENGDPIVVDPLEDKELYKYQLELTDMVIAKPHPRHIHWIWSIKGNVGKSSTCKHLALKYGAIILGGRLQDSLYVVAKMQQLKKPPKICVFDIPRSAKGQIDYQILEKVKDGCFMSSKYEAAMVLMNPPHVIVFANCSPVLNLLSQDRWKIRRLDFDEDLPGRILDFNDLGIDTSIY